MTDPQQDQDEKLLLHPDAGVPNIESKIDTFVDQLSNLALILTKHEVGAS